MSVYIDSHLHTSFSVDSDTPPEIQIERAIALGMPSLCITDHQDFDGPPDIKDFTFDTKAYWKALLPLKEAYRGKIDLRIGVELGLQTGIPSDLAAYAASQPFDFIIGSIHFCDGMDPYYPKYYEGRTEDAAYRAYFEEELKNFKAYDCFDSAGHLDYIVRYGPNKNTFYTYEKFRDIFDEILKLLIQRGQGLECNTAGFKAGLGHPHPTEAILKRYRELGGEILTLGSDAHRPEHLAFHFDQIGDLLKSCGFRYYTIFKGRKPEFLPL
ncbi:MAG: histidinol-phosphatase HisJ family protein [Lachnospiraceae bacterium]|nr:histidinol-phosphatase HisJ family protein [Lachnospiraceae bacterium]